MDESERLESVLMSVCVMVWQVFRTNSSYGRWDEARKMWGSLVNRMRDLVRQANSWFPEDVSTNPSDQS